MIDPQVLWTTPAPFWAEITDPADRPTRQAFRQPALLRFATDSFMDEFMATLASDPARVRQLRAQPGETWRNPSLPAAPIKSLPPFVRNLAKPGLIATRPAGGRAVSNLTIDAPSTEKSLKLYHPAHQRFYLVAACLACRLPGLPDRGVDPSDQERVSFVIRRLLPPPNQTLPLKDWDEYAFVDGAWQKLIDPETMVAAAEEELPLSPVTFQAEEARKRRLWIGLVPVAKREAYMGASTVEAASASASQSTGSPSPIPQLKMLLLSQVIEPWKNLVNAAYNLQYKIAKARPGATSGDRPAADIQAGQQVKTARNQFQETSWYLLLDLANYLETHLKSVSDALQKPGLQSALRQVEKDVIAALQQTRNLDPSVASARTLEDALVEIKKNADKLESVATAYDSAAAAALAAWPNFLFRLVDLDLTQYASDPKDAMDPVVARPMLNISQPPGTLDPSLPRVEALKQLIDRLADTIVAALLTQEAAALLPPIPLAAKPLPDASDPGWFVIRCIFQRPNCGPLQPPVVSKPTAVFQLAAFFDPDAPARPIRIALPVDTSPAGLRKFDKNTAFVISDVLCGQIERAKGLGLADLVLSVLPWPFHKDLSVPDRGPCKDGVELGMICSLSIPIITICALILLMIIVNLLDIIFHWVPLFILCFPFPKFSAKPSLPSPGG